MLRKIRKGYPKSIILVSLRKKTLPYIIEDAVAPVTPGLHCLQFDSQQISRLQISALQSFVLLKSQAENFYEVRGGRALTLADCVEDCMDDV